MPVGSVLVGSVVFQNTGTERYGFDVVLEVGKGTSFTDFQVKAWNYVENVTLDPGKDNSANPTKVELGPLGSDFIGTWDVLVVVADVTYDPATGRYLIAAYDWLICHDALVIS
jgi:hypothetical protein